MEQELPGVKNYFVKAEEIDKKLVMLYKLVPGKVNKSYGLYVAEILDFPA